MTEAAAKKKSKGALRRSSADVPFQSASLDIWDKKYRLKTKEEHPVDGSIDETYQRVAKALAEVEESKAKQEHWYERFLWALRHGAVPAGRIISNAGSWDHKPATSTINCTVSGTINDSMDGILKRVHEAGLTLKAGCGIGYEFSTLRPRGAYVSGAGAYTSGPLSFMDIYDKMCFTVSSAGGRRGAQMATFDVGHPDVTDFIRAKREDGRLRQFNFSLLISDGFMEAVEADGEWPLAFPLTEAEVVAEGIDLDDEQQVLWREWPSKEGYVTDGEGRVACRIYQKIKARHLWNLIMTSTYDYAEPGFILIDQYNELNNNWFCEEIRATNPCVTADTWVQTDQGPRQVADLLGRPFRARVHGEDYASGADGFFHTGRKPVVRLRTRDGMSLRLTADHRVRRATQLTPWGRDEQWCPTGELAAGDQVVLHDHRSGAQWGGRYSEDDGYLMGLLIGNGAIRDDGQATLSLQRPAAVANDSQVSGVAGVMAAAERAVSRYQYGADAVAWQESPEGDGLLLTTGGLGKLATELGVNPRAMLPTAEMERSSSDFHRGFLRGLFDVEGSLIQAGQHTDASVCLAHSERASLEQIQRMLLRLGIVGRIRVGQAQHELLITGENLRTFRDEVGFADTDKRRRLDAALSSCQHRLNHERFVAEVASVEADGEADVYDVQVPGVNAFDGHGVMVHNCGEQGLPPYGACLLGSINLTMFVRDPFTAKAHFDWDTFREVVSVFSRMLDNTVEINGLPLSEQRREIERKRRHGMGFLGLGSTVTMLRMRYGDEESVAFTEEVAKQLALVGWQSALDLAREKGPAPIMEEMYKITPELMRKRPELAADGYEVGEHVPARVLWARYSRYMQRIAEVEPELVDELANVGGRFTHHSSIAPTGTISLSLANNASNGIEPSFAHHYVRNLIREGRKTKESVDVFSFELLAYRHFINEAAMPESSDAELGGLPDYFISADDVTPKQHVDIQAAAQKWVDSSISKTANVPTDYPYEDFKDIYRYAYQQGLKGCTTFRFNPEVFQGVLVKEKDLADTTYRFRLEDGSVLEARGDEEIEYDGEVHTAANLYEALKEGYYGKF
ncbi:ribonucleoside-diphosphate reductase [Halorhodospira halochloris]|uniref:LAGLIDADG family homing endonuclease n=1 Tax=Halorhodospira halochloris TaxID=1052 RepID=UPI001EE83A6D|nr:LAGLIDADG family homing endonuclease [Halorhodospira halochloris]MCG5529961.1 ribonucleoside-diphosphate reductase [Halorhodospira halochloris]